MTTDYVPDLRRALVAAGFTYDGVADLLGTTAHTALARNETTPGLRRTAGGSPLETLTRLFLLQTTTSLDRAEAALPGLVERLCAEGLLERSVGEVAARLDLRPYATDDRDLWVISDLTPGLDGSPDQVASDHVLGISSASTSLAQLTLRDPVERALDLGTGCGVQALHLAGHSEQVVATDVNRRALRIAELNARLNRPTSAVTGGPGRIEVREGSFFDPVRDERFDLITTNPPFVISPGTGDRLVYRDSGLPGDRVVEDIVRGAPGHLTAGGWCQVLANWVITEGRPWQDRLTGWIEGCDAWVIQREVLDPAAYVELWLKDAGRHGAADYRSRYDTWLGWFDDQRVEGIGFGWIHLHRTDAEPVLRLEEWPWEVEQPIGPAVAAWGRTVDRRRERDDSLFTARLLARPDVRQETVGAPGAEHPETILLRQQRGMRRARTTDTALAAFYGACDGELTVGQIVAALGDLLDRPVDALWAELEPVLGELLDEGYLAFPPAD